jgi:RNA polymerase sigma-70 factor (ECF subfamily)
MAHAAPDSEETQQLLELIRAGDRQAFERLFERHRTQLRQMIEVRTDSRLRARVDPSDVVQETHLEAFRRLPDYLQRRPIPFHLWLRKMAYERLLNLRRDHVTAARRSVLREVPVPDPSSLQLAQRLLPSGSSPSVRLARSELATAAGNVIFSNLLLDTSGSYTLSALANLSTGGTLGPVVSSNFTVASPVSLSFGSITYNSKTGLYSETVTLTNTTSSTLTGPISLVLTNLPSGVTLTDATGTTNGNPYYRFLTSGKTLKAKASTSITLTFTAASLSEITFGTEVVVGL